MQNNSLEQVMNHTLTNKEYLTSEKRCFRLIMSNISKGLICIYGDRKIGKKLFLINLVENLIFYNDVDVLYISNTHSIEELAIRILTCRGGVNPIYNSCIIGIKDYINRNLQELNNVSIIDKNICDLETIKCFALKSKHKHKIVVMDNVDSEELKDIKEHAINLNIIVIATISCGDLPNELHNVKNICEASDAVVKIEPSFEFPQKKYIKVNIIKNKNKEQDIIEMKVNQFRQKIYEVYEKDYYDIDENELL